MLTQRVSIFMSLPVSSLDRLTLRNRLDDIGRAALDSTREKA
jgi:hypothetical protein